jgi:hypothetical protein
MILIMEAARTSERSVNFYQIIRCNNSEDRHLAALRTSNLTIQKDNHGCDVFIYGLFNNDISLSHYIQSNGRMAGSKSWEIMWKEAAGT